MIKDKYGDRLDCWIKGIFPFLFRRTVDPNLLTVVGTLICLVAAVVFGMGWFLLGGLLLGLGGVFDLVDGVVARHFARTSSFGAFLDSTLDRLVDMAVLLGLVIHYAGAGEMATALVAGIVLISSVLTSYTKARAEGLDLDLPGGLIERGERVALLILGGVFDVMVPVLWLLAAGASATVVQRFTGARRRIESRETARASGGERLAHGE